MKRTLLFSSVTAMLIAVLLFSSCSQNGNLTIEKRHYRGGFYVHHSSNPADQKAAESKTTVAFNNAATEKTEAAPAAETTVKENAPVAASQPVQAKPAVKEEKANRVEKTESVVSQNGGSDKTTVAEKAPAKQNNVKNAAKQMNKNQAADGNVVLLLILALFLPWLAVLLFEGSVTTNFWIALLLWFLFIIPGAIFAWLVILGVI